MAVCLSAEILIRPAREGDFAAIVELYRELEGPYGGPDSCEETSLGKYRVLYYEILADENQEVFIAESKGIPVGTVTLVVVPNLGHRGSPWAAIDNLVVRPDFRGHGVGKALMEAASELAWKKKCYKVVLSSNIQRADAHRFYRLLGWRLTHLGFEIC